MNVLALKIYSSCTAKKKNGCKKNHSYLLDYDIVNQFVGWGLGISFFFFKLILSLL